MLDRVLEAERTVSPPLPATEVTVPVLISARAWYGHVVLRRDKAVLQSDHRCSELECRSRRITSLNHFVDQRPALVLEQLLVIIDRDSARKLVRVPARCAVEREYFSGAWVDRDGAALQRIGKDSRHEFLEVQIDVRVKRRCAFRAEIGTRSFTAHRPSARIHLVESDSFATVENVLILLLESGLTNRLAGLVARVFGIVELRVGDLAGVTDERSHDRPIRIVAFRDRLDDETREIEPMLLENRHNVDRRVGKNCSRPCRRSAISSDREVDVVLSELQRRRELPERGAKAVDTRRRNRNRIRRKILGDYLAVPIVNDAARRWQRYRAQTVFFRLHHVLLVLDYLRIEERADQQQESDSECQRAHSGPASDVIRMKAHAGAGSSSGRIMKSNRTPTAAVTAAESGDQSSSCWSSSTPFTRCSPTK